MYFLSYAHKNKSEVAAIIKVFKEQGVEVWFDSGLISGDLYNIKIAEKIKNCDGFIAVFSHAYFRSMYCKQELVYARENCRKKIFPIVIEKDLILPPDIEMLMVGIHFFFMNDGIDETALIKEIQKFNEIEMYKGAQNSTENQVADMIMICPLVFLGIKQRTS